MRIGTQFKLQHGGKAGGADKNIIGGEIIERTNPHVVPAAKDFAVLPVMDDKDKIADQMVDARFPPLQIAEQDQFRVAISGHFRRIDIQFFPQLVPVVQPRPGGRRRPARGVIQRGRLQPGAGRVPMEALDQQAVFVIRQKAALVRRAQGISRRITA